ncbi:hypothetical protein ACH4LK_07160 [Streptomyces lydicus]|uniref:hypothetical protein n=1 Tax=Streptomyces lydicus TaxID=47763 RepID=UPI00378A4A8D
MADRLLDSLGGTPHTIRNSGSAGHRSRRHLEPVRARRSLSMFDTVLVQNTAEWQTTC